MITRRLHNQLQCDTRKAETSALHASVCLQILASAVLSISGSVSGGAVRWQLEECHVRRWVIKLQIRQHQHINHLSQTLDKTLSAKSMQW